MPTTKPTAEKAVHAKKAPAKKKVVSDDEKAPAAAGEYIYALGRRKRAVAQTRLWSAGKGEITVNKKPFEKYFTVQEYREALLAPLKTVGQDDKVTITLDVRGGGMRGQAEASRLGISRALIELNPTFRTSLKQKGFLTRDPREKERKKPGKKKARKGSQWAKR